MGSTTVFWIVAPLSATSLPETSPWVLVVASFAEASLAVVSLAVASLAATFLVATSSATFLVVASQASHSASNLAVLNSMIGSSASQASSMNYCHSHEEQLTVEPVTSQEGRRVKARLILQAPPHPDMPPRLLTPYPVLLQFALGGLVTWDGIGDGIQDLVSACLQDIRLHHIF